MQKLIDAASRRLATASRVAVLTGAGISKESGLPTFRDPETGLWARYDPMQLATMEGFHRDPKLVWEWYEYRFGLARTAKPNPGHLAIAELAGILPQVSVITQNIDGLHQAAGSTDVIELHGSILRHRCLRGHTGFTWDDVTRQGAMPPHCPYCNALLRPEVVWFGEMLPQAEIARSFALSESCDVMLVVGTAGQVQPAASLPFVAADAGAFVIDVNPNRDDTARAAHIFLQGPGGTVLPELLAAVRAGQRRHVYARNEIRA
ncbi:MAG TPA: NAD-dependent deacylase [Anaerolineae bacterium]